MSSRYEKLESDELGTTAWGTIFRGCDMNLDSDVAILELYPCFKNNVGIWKNARVAKNIAHDLLISATDLDEEHGWIIMELRGSSLKQWIKKLPLPQSVVRTLLSQFLELLLYFEEQNFVHGDIRPDTLFLPLQQQLSTKSDRQYVKLSFSLGATIDQVVPTTGRSTKFFAPEMINPDFGKIAPATDMYCLAFTMLELLVGPTFDQFFERINMPLESVWMYWHGNASEEIPSIRTIFPEVDSDLDQALTSMLRKSQSERPGSAHDVLDILDLSKNLTLSDSVFKQIVGPAHKNKKEQIIAGEHLTSNWSAKDHQVDSIARKKVTKESQGPKPWSKPWIQLHTKRPCILWPAISLLLVLVVIQLAFLFAPASIVPVALVIEPDEAQLIMQQKNKSTPLQRDKNGKFRLPVGKDSFLVESLGCETFQSTLIVSKEGKIYNEDKTQLNEIILPVALLPFEFLVSPADAMMYIDGQKKEFEGNSLMLPYGSYDVVFMQSNYVPSFPQRLDLHDKNVSWVIRLEKNSQTERDTIENLRQELFDVIFSLKPILWEKYDNDVRLSVLNQYFETSYSVDFDEKDIPILLEEIKQKTIISYNDVVNKMFKENVNIKKEWNEIDKTAQYFIEHFPMESQYLAWKAIAKSQLGHYDESLVLFKKINDISPDNIEWIIIQANIALRQQQYLDAIDAYSRAININTNDAILYYSRGLARAGVNRHLKAIEDFTMAINLDENMENAYLERAHSQLSIALIDEAVLDLDAAEKINPKNANIYFLRGEARKAKSESSDNKKELWDKALADYSNAIQLDPNMDKAYDSRATLFELLQNKQRAEDDFRKAKQIRNDFIAN